MVTTQRQNYQSLSPIQVGNYSPNLKLLVEPKEDFQQYVTSRTTKQFEGFNLYNFEDMEKESRGFVRDLFLGHVEGISLLDWKLRFCT